MHIEFRVEHISEPAFDCECCGTCFPQGMNIYVNDTLVWHKYSDGHMGGSQSEASILQSVVKGWSDVVVYHIEANHTEKKRHEWNKEHPGNGVARTVESWNEHKEQILGFHQNSVENVIGSCDNLPYDELLQVKMIALWVESESGQKIVVNETVHNTYRDTDDDFDL